MRTWILLFLIMCLSITHGVVLVPSSLHEMALRPTFRALDLRSLSNLGQVMAKILKSKTDFLSQEPLRPTNISVVIQKYELLSLDDERSQFSEAAGVKAQTSIIKYFVLGKYDEGSASLATRFEFMDTLVSITFGGKIFKDEFIDLLRSSKDNSLKDVLDTTSEKDAMSFFLGKNFEDKTTLPSIKATLTAVDIVLIVVSSLIFASIVCTVIIHQKGHSEVDTESHSTRFSSRALSENFPDISGLQSSNIQFVLKDTRKGMQRSNLNNSVFDDHLEITYHAKSKRLSENEHTVCLESSFGDLSMSGKLSVESECFPSRWFGGSPQSFSVDSDDIFAVDVDGNQNAEICSKQGETLVRGKSIAEWQKSIRVIPSENSTLVSAKRILSDRDHYREIS